MFKNYLTIALRNLVRQKLYAFINIFGLALGVACCPLILLFVEHEWSFDKFHAKANRLYRAIHVERKSDGAIEAMSYQPLPLGPALIEEFPEIEQTVRIFTGGGAVSYGDKHFAERFIFTDSVFWEVFDFSWLRGNRAHALGYFRWLVA